MIGRVWWARLLGLAAHIYVTIALGLAYLAILGGLPWLAEIGCFQLAGAGLAGAGAWWLRRPERRAVRQLRHDMKRERL